LFHGAPSRDRSDTVRASVARTLELCQHPLAVVMSRRVIHLLVLVPAIATADPAKDRAALARFEATYQATAKASGTARVTQACTDANNLYTTGHAFSPDTAPADAPVDDPTWSDAAGLVERALADLVEVCKRPDHKRPMLGSDVQTADDVVKTLDKDVQVLLDTAKPRALPAAITPARTALAAMTLSDKSLCTNQRKLATALVPLAQAPAGADAAAWKKQFDMVKGINDGVKSGACGRHREADEQIVSGLNDLHDNFFALVLLVPPI
jgi:hypothetical protein